MITNRIQCVAIVAALIFSAGTASGEGIPVIDRTSILKHIEYRATEIATRCAPSADRAGAATLWFAQQTDRHGRCCQRS